MLSDSQIENDPYWKKLLQEAKKADQKLLRAKWALGFKDRGMGHGDFAVITKRHSKLIVECPNRTIAEHIIKLHNEAK